MTTKEKARPTTKPRRTLNTLEPVVSCDVCMKEIPTSVAVKKESRDYVLYFCGLDCFEKWNEEGEKST